LAGLAGADVFATAGSSEKRELLRALGVPHVMDSRTLAFADEILAATNGEGVDAVLNSLSGEALEKGLSVLRDYGRFLEIGKRDIYQNSRVGLRPFRNNLSFFSIDLDRALRQLRPLLGGMLRELSRHFDQNTLTPLIHRVFPIAHAASAFRYVAQARHIGKVVLTLIEPDVPVAPTSDDSISFRSDGTYLVTGGLGGFGLTAARWLVDQGARHLVLLGRSGAASAETEAALAAMRQIGAEVRVARADVGDAAQLAGVLQEVRRNMPPLRGVFHSAMVLKDSLVVNTTDEHLRAVWGPKVSGAWNLHALTLEDPLDHFVLFSSMASMFGAGGQANYVSANTYLESLARWRRAEGRPGLAISWGYLGEVGFVARHREVGERFAAMGVESFTPREALALLGRFLCQDATHAGVMRVNWRRFQQVMADTIVSPRFSQLIRQSQADEESSAGRGRAALRSTLLAASPEEQRVMLAAAVREQVARVLGAAPENLDVEKPVTDLGLDSLMAVELRNWVEGELRLSLPAVELLHGPSVTQLVETLLRQLDPANQDAPRGEPVSGISQTEELGAADATAAEVGASADKFEQELSASVDDLSDDQVEALLGELEGIHAAAAKKEPGA
jgi:NADPH:quinone reductase-like Zn-dependent oxidoreductase/acyl carrier protein